MDQQQLAMILQSQPRERSYLLAQVLQQMNQPRQNPQSPITLAARLGEVAINKRTMDKQMQAQQQTQATQAQELAKALGTYQKQAQGGPVNIPLGDVAGGPPQQMQQQYMADPQGARQGLMGSLVQNQNPMAQQLASQLMGQMVAPPKPPEAQSPIGKLQADVNAGLATPKDLETARAPKEDLPSEVKIAQFLFPDDVAAQRKHLQKESPKDTPMQIQLARWAADGDEAKARKLVLDGMNKGDKLSLGGVLAPIVEKMASGKPLSPGEQKAMDWYKQNPLAALFGLLGGAAQAGTKVED